MSGTTALAVTATNVGTAARGLYGAVAGSEGATGVRVTWKSAQANTGRFEESA